ncbi:MAG: hypothetical protein ABI068_15450 [Ktedonobacterales bacterium]
MAMLTSETTQSGQNTPQTSARLRRPGLYALIFGVITAVVTLAAVALAAVAPSLEPNASAAIPAGWSQVYNGDLTKSVDQWDTQHGCSNSFGGLFAQGDSQNGRVCQFQPSASGSVTGQGFAITASIAPASQTDLQEIPIIAIGNTASALVSFNQQGAYVVCDGTCDPSAGDGLYIKGTTAAWHTDPYVPNTITVRLDADGTTLTVYANGEQIASGRVRVDSDPQVAIGADANAQALFTHVTIYSGSGA